MGKSKKPRKRYRPGPVCLDALAKLQPVDQERGRLLIGTFRSALHTITTGHHPGEEEWRALGDAVNTIEVLCLEMGLLDVDATMPAVKVATDSLVAAAKRWREKSVMRLDGAGVQALVDVIGIYEECGRGFTLHTMHAARARVQERYCAALVHGTDHEVVAL